MKLKALVITALFLAGVAASVAVAKGPPPGKGKNKTATSSTASTGTGSTDDGQALRQEALDLPQDRQRQVGQDADQQAGVAGPQAARRPRPRGRARLDRDDVDCEHRVDRLDRHDHRKVHGRRKLRRAGSGGTTSTGTTTAP